MTLHHPQPKRGLRLPRSLVILSAPLLISLSSFSIWAQDPEDVVRVRTDLVAVPFIVSDTRGRRVSGLKGEDFTLLDDARPAKIDYFASGTDQVALLFALDASGSAREIVKQQREAASALFSRFGRGSRVAGSGWREAGGEKGERSAEAGRGTPNCERSDASRCPLPASLPRGETSSARTARLSLMAPRQQFVPSMAAVGSRPSGASSC